jgi:midasin (ATPase involved in ribosome maturation)
VKNAAAVVVVVVANQGVDNDDVGVGDGAGDARVHDAADDLHDTGAAQLLALLAHPFPNSEHEDDDGDDDDDEDDVGEVESDDVGRVADSAAVAPR